MLDEPKIYMAVSFFFVGVSLLVGDASVWSYTGGMCIGFAGGLIKSHPQQKEGKDESDRNI